MSGSGKTAYRLTEHGQVVVVDRPHLTNGAIVPNYVVDLYLPIVGYVGLGVLTMLYRFVNCGKHQLRLDLHKQAKVGRVGFRTLERSLDLLQECRIIDVTKPQGLDRRFHRRTVIELLDPPTEVPQQWAREVIERTPAGWLFEQEVSVDTSMEMSDSTSIKVPANTSMLDVPTWDVPTKDVSSSSLTRRPDDGDDSVVAYLQSKGVVAAQEFKHLDFEAVRDRVEFLERDPNLLPGGIVKSLRASPPAPVARDRYGVPITGPIDVSRYVNGEYGDLFRLGSDTSGLEDPSTTFGQSEEATQ